MLLSALLVLGLICGGATIENVAVKCDANSTCSDSKKVCEKGFCHIALGKQCTVLTEEPSTTQTGTTVTTTQNGGSSEKVTSTSAPKDQSSSAGQQKTTTVGTSVLPTLSVTTTTKATQKPSSTSVASTISTATSTVFTGTNSTTTTNKRKRRSEDDKRECVTNAVCKQAGENKICTCANGFSKDANGWCAEDAGSGAGTFSQMAITLFTSIMALMYLI